MKRKIAIFIMMLFLMVSSVGSLGQLKELKELFGNIEKEVKKIAPFVISDERVGLFFAHSLIEVHGESSNNVYSSQLSQIAEKLVSSNKFRSKYEFKVLRGNDFNAFSSYGGKCYFFEGMLKDTQNNDAETAFVIAHEIAHNELGHNKEAVKNFRIQHALELTKIDRKIPEIVKLGVQAVGAKRSRENELKADLQALEYMKVAGISRTGAIAVFRRIEAEHAIEQKRKNTSNSSFSLRFDDIFESHPDPSVRALIAEDEYFQEKYGSNYRQIAGASDVNDFSSSAIIVAHPSLWMPIKIHVGRVDGVGIFNPVGSEKTDVLFFINACKSGKLVAVTADNDSHDFRSGTGEGTANRFTFIQCGSSNPNDLISAIKQGSTYASCDGTKIERMNFSIGRTYPKVAKVALNFTLSQKGCKVICYRDGEKIGTFSENSGKFTITDLNANLGRHWYVLYVPDKLITSPITFNVTSGNTATSTHNTTSWKKGIIHYHSFYSDGKTKSIQEIWNSGRKNNIDFIFMTDHADMFEDKQEYERFESDCKRASDSMTAGIEYPIGNKRFMNHLLLLNLNSSDYWQYRRMDESEFLDLTDGASDEVSIIEEQFHLGDDNAQDEMIKDAEFIFSKCRARLSLWVKGSPFKDPIIWINRHEIGRIVTTDGKWHLFTFNVPEEYLINGKNLFHIESYIPDRWQTFDDCEIKEIRLCKIQ